MKKRKIVLDVAFIIALLFFLWLVCSWVEIGVLDNRGTDISSFNLFSIFFNS